MSHPYPDPTDDGQSNPINFAVASRDKHVLYMVEDAVRNKRTMLAYQAVHMAQNTGNIGFYEGLIRIQDSSGRIIPARQFISTVETTELGRKIDCLALEQGLNALSEYDFLRLSINMSARSIGYAPWLETLNHGIAKRPQIAERLILEITESSCIHMPDVVSAFMKDLQARGISFALDDFGAGYTSFRYLRDLLFDIVKIDGQFIRDIHKDADNQILAQALISIGKQFDMVTVAEGVENQEDVDFLKHSGIDLIQGYYFGTPRVRPPWMTAGEKAHA
jgi:EAL domain-containing protein (putative c-di-GMP-specific phosphodiesterase class I)